MLPSESVTRHPDQAHLASVLVLRAEWGAVLFVVTLSLGESVWSPRWYDYSMSLAPEGREGIFTALASAPLFAAKLPTGASWRNLGDTLAKPCAAEPVVPIYCWWRWAIL